MGASASAQRQLAFNLRTNAKLERAARSNLRKEFIKRIKAAANAYKKNGLMGAEMALNGHEDALDDILRNQYLRTAAVYGPKVLDSLKGDGAWASKDFSDDLYEQLVSQWLNSPDTDRIGRDIASTTRAQIRAIIAQGIRDGLSIAAIAKNIRNYLGGVSASMRSHIIARTEVHNAASFASDAAARSSGLPDLMKEWVSVQDDRTRGFPTSDHFLADGEIKQMDDPFQFTRKNGSSYLLMRPGDPNGPANGIINCRCVLAYRPADAL